MLNLFQRVNDFFERMFSRLFERKKAARRIVMESQLRVDGSGQVRVIKVPTNEVETDEHERAGA